MPEIAIILICGGVACCFLAGALMHCTTRLVEKLDELVDRQDANSRTNLHWLGATIREMGWDLTRGVDKQAADIVTAIEYNSMCIEASAENATRISREFGTVEADESGDFKPSR